MSDLIFQVEGLKEIPNRKTREPIYTAQEVYFTKFSGGVTRGRSLQITIGDEHVQLNHVQAELLSKILKEYWPES